ncbi:LPXTG cell wall anchor domain-containing protein [Marmoricola sp. URHA0025 HA25]
MKKFVSLGLAAFAALAGVLVILGAQTPAQAYPELSISLSVNRTVLYGGQTFTATATGNVTCDWDLAWNGAVRDAHRAPNAAFDTTFTAPKVTKVTKIPLHGTCVYDAAEHPSARTTAAWQRTIVITLLPRSSAVSPPVGSHLPSTGGPNLLFLVGGLGLLVAGATAVTVARRRAEEAEIQASGA